LFHLSVVDDTDGQKATNILVILQVKETLSRDISKKVTECYINNGT